MVMGGDSRSEGRGFESRHRKNLKCLFEKTENKQKRRRGWPIKKNICRYFRRFNVKKICWMGGIRTAEATGNACCHLTIVSRC